MLALRTAREWQQNQDKLEKDIERREIEMIHHKLKNGMISQVFEQCLSSINVHVNVAYSSKVM